MQLNEKQQAAVAAGETTFLIGPAGTGKSTALHQRLLRLLQEEPAYTILVLVAEEEDGERFLEFLHEQDAGPYADLKIATYGRLAREMVSLFWPLVARAAGFSRPFQPPSFLSYDLAQLLMWRIVRPMREAGAFADLPLRPQQIVSQLLDTLNRAALNRLTLGEAQARQLQTWAGESEGARHLQEAAHAARHFREHCRRHSLLDLSLTVRTFDTEVVDHPEFHRYFAERFRHLMVDNVEEQTPAGQHFVAALMDTTETTVIAYDAGGGYKRFLAADPRGARQFHRLSAKTVNFDEPFTTATPLIHLSNQAENYLLPAREKKPVERANEAIIGVLGGRYRREMVQRLTAMLAHLQRDVAPHEIAIVTPYLDEGLHYMLNQALKAADIPSRLLRRRASPRDRPRVRAWLTWMALANPAWEMAPSPYDVAEALTLSIAGLDAARAELLTEAVYRPERSALLPAAELADRIQERVGRDRVTMVEDLRRWLDEEGDQAPDIFLHRLFNELLARPPFQPQPDEAGAAVCEWLVRTATRLREVAPRLELATPAQVGRAFIESVNQGLVTAYPPELGEPPDPEGVLVSTIYGYLLAGRPVRVQVWLDATANGWWDIPRQPLSNAFVLAQSWPAGEAWTMETEFRVRNELLSRLIRGLTARCSEGVILATSDLDRRGQRQDGRLWHALRPVLARREEEGED